MYPLGVNAYQLTAIYAFDPIKVLAIDVSNYMQGMGDTVKSESQLESEYTILTAYLYTDTKVT